MNLAQALSLRPCPVAPHRHCPRCVAGMPSEDEIRSAQDLHARAEALGLVPANEAAETALRWRVRRPRLITLRALVLELAGALADVLLWEIVGACRHVDLAELRALAERLGDVAASFDRRLERGVS